MIGMCMRKQYEIDTTRFKGKRLIVERSRRLVALEKTTIDKRADVICLDHGTGAGDGSGCAKK